MRGRGMCTFFWERGLRAVGRCEMPARQDSAYTPLLVRTKASSDDSAWQAAQKRSGTDGLARRCHVQQFACATNRLGYSRVML